MHHFPLSHLLCRPIIVGSANPTFCCFCWLVAVFYHICIRKRGHFNYEADALYCFVVVGNIFFPPEISISKTARIGFFIRVMLLFCCCFFPFLRIQIEIVLLWDDVKLICTICIRKKRKILHHIREKAIKLCDKRPFLRFFVVRNLNYISSV